MLCVYVCVCVSVCVCVCVCVCVYVCVFAFGTLDLEFKDGIRRARFVLLDVLFRNFLCFRVDTL